MTEEEEILAQMVAKMARDANRDHLADLAILEQQARAKAERHHNTESK